MRGSNYRALIGKFRVFEIDCCLQEVVAHLSGGCAVFLFSCFCMAVCHLLGMKGSNMCILSLV